MWRLQYPLQFQGGLCGSYEARTRQGECLTPFSQRSFQLVTLLGFFLRGGGVEIPLGGCREAGSKRRQKQTQCCVRTNKGTITQMHPNRPSARSPTCNSEEHHSSFRKLMLKHFFFFRYLMHSPSHIADLEEAPVSTVRQILQLLPQSLPTQPSQTQGVAEGLHLPVSAHADLARARHGTDASLATALQQRSGRCGQIYSKRTGKAPVVADGSMKSPVIYFLKKIHRQADCQSVFKKGGGRKINWARV